LQLRLQFWNESERLGVGIIEIKDDQRRLLFTILQHAISEVLVVLGELDLDVQLARCLLNLSREEQVVDEGKDTGVGIFAQGQRFGIDGREGCSETRTRPAPCALAIVACQCGAIAVIHGRGVDAILIVARLAGAGGAGTAWIVRASSATPTVSASTTTGGSSWSCVH